MIRSSKLFAFHASGSGSARSSVSARSARSEACCCKTWAAFRLSCARSSAACVLSSSCASSSARLIAASASFRAVLYVFVSYSFRAAACIARVTASVALMPDSFASLSSSAIVSVVSRYVRDCLDTCTPFVIRSYSILTTWKRHPGKPGQYGSLCYCYK